MKRRSAESTSAFPVYLPFGLGFRKDIGEERLDVVFCGANVCEKFFALVCQFIHSFSVVHVSLYEVLSF